MSSFTISRVFKAPRSLVFNCCVKPSHFEKWFGPADCTFILRHADVRPAIAFAEACFISERGRVPLALADLISAIDSDARLIFVSLDRAILERTATLIVIGEMHDRQIVATALVLQEAGKSAVVLTKDSNITASGLVTHILKTLCVISVCVVLRCLADFSVTEMPPKLAERPHKAT